MGGLFVVFEGGDGVGKSRQTEWLASWLGEQGLEVVRTFEPGDSPVGQQIRRIVLSPDTRALSPRAEALLYAADKAQHVDAVVRPALARGAVVISDRYVDSTLAYQGAGRVLDRDEVEWINRWATEDLRPDVTVLMDLDPSEGVGSLAERDRIEAEPDDFHARVRAGFLDLAARDPERYLVLAARDPKETNRARVRARVAALLGWSVPPGTVVP
jgi:dTMP kinase